MRRVGAGTVAGAGARRTCTRTAAGTATHSSLAALAGAAAACALVNTGACLARWTNDVWRATAHRVIVPSASVASKDRYSIACFIDPDAAATVAVDARFVRAGEAPKYAETTGRDYLLSKLREAQGVDGAPSGRPQAEDQRQSAGGKRKAGEALE